MSDILIRNLVKKFNDKKVLNHINLNISENNIYGLLGSNGAGKSTLMNIISDRIFANSGEITINNRYIHNNDYILSNIFLINGNNMYSSTLKISQIFKMTNEIYGDFNFKLSSILSRKFKLNINTKFGKLSMGYRTICKLIIALCVPVKFILLDEPTLGLDANNRSLFYSELIKSYIRKPRTFIIATHLINEMENIFNHIIILKNGRVLLDDSIDTIYKLAYKITGPKDKINSYKKKVNVVGESSLGKLKTIYIYDYLYKNYYSNDLKIEKMNLQELFINLTKNRRN